MQAHLSFGDWLKRRRRANGLTQEQLADQVGCSAIALRKIEAGERRPSAQIVERLARILEIPQAELKDFLRFARGQVDARSQWVAEERPWLAGAAAPRLNVPLPLTSFVGREQETAAISRALESSRLVTLKGPGGVGKTRLAIQCTRQLAGAFRDGACWVDLAALSDPGLVPQALATSLGIGEIPNESLNNVLLSHLVPRQMLLSFDNCEHLIAACAQLAQMLLGSCPQIRILTTSREPLGAPGEHVHAVPVLSLPSSNSLSMSALLMQFEGVRLFVDRATASNPQFTLTDQDAITVAHICLRLDGMPLAIELAAARMAMMSPSEIAQRLDDRFSLLTAGSRTALPRHQTLRAAIEWSHDLLSMPERTLLRSLSVFAGGFTLDAAEVVAGSDALPRSQVTGLLGQLINKSLVVVEARPEAESETRYRLFETIHEFAREKLAASGEAAAVLRRHRDYYVDLAELAEPQLKRQQQAAWLDRLELEHDDLRSVLQRAISAADAPTAQHLGWALSRFWRRRGLLKEGRTWLEHALMGSQAAPPSEARARALHAAADLARGQGDFASTRHFVEESIAVWQALAERGHDGLFIARVLLGNLMRDEGDAAGSRRLLEECAAFFRGRDDTWSLAWCLMSLGLSIRDQEDYDLARAAIEEAVALSRRQGDLWSLGEALHHLGLVAYRQGQYEAAIPLVEEAFAIRRQLRDRQGIAYSHHTLGVFTLALGDVEAAKPFLEQGLKLFREVGDRSGTALALQYEGLMAGLQGDDRRAGSILVEGLKLAVETGPRWIAGNYLLWLAGVAAARGQLPRAVRLSSAARVWSAAGSSFWDAFETAYYERIMAEALRSLGQTRLSQEQAAGQSMNLEEAIALALEAQKGPNDL